jgi:hypothetical protein
MTPSAMALGSARTVGDVLLENGTISASQLDQALARQQATGQPLGQILVESGVISRLDLASALAEQWSDAPHMVRVTPGKPGSALPTFSETIAFEAPVGGAGDAAIAELRAFMHAFAARLDGVEARGGGVEVLHERMGELRQMVAGLADWASGPELRIAELEGRAAGMDEQVAELSGRLDQVIAGIDRAITGLEEHAAGIAGSVEVLGGRIDAGPTLEQLLEVKAVVADLVARPAIDPAAVEALAERLDQAASAVDLERLSGSVEKAATTEQVDDLRALVEALEARPAGDPEIADKLAAVISRIEEIAARPVVEPGLSDRFEALAAGLGGAATASDLAELRVAVEELSGRATADPSRVDDLADRVGELTTRLDGIAVSADGKVDANVVTELREAVDALAARPAGDPELAARVDQVAAAVALAVGSDDLTELRLQVEGIAAHVSDDALADTVEALRAEVEALVGSTEGHSGLVARVEELAARLDGLSVSSVGSVDASVVAELRARIDELAVRPAIESGAAEEIAAIRAEIALGGAAEREAIALLEARLASLEAAPAAASDDGEPGAVAEVSVRLDELAARVEAVALAVPSGPSSADGAGAAAPVGEIDKLRVSVESLWMRMSEFQKMVGSLLDPRGVAGKLERIEQRLESLEAGGGKARPAAGAELGSGDLREIARRIEEMESSSTNARETLLTSLERMASAIDWRLQRLERTGGVASARQSAANRLTEDQKDVSGGAVLAKAG